jgi:hypothetical protein
LWENTDSVDVAAAKRVLSGRYAFLEQGVVASAASGEWVAPWAAGPSETADVRRRFPWQSTAAE